MTTKNEQQYLDALKLVKDKGIECHDRTGVGTKRYTGIQMRFNLEEGFPAVTTKKLAFYPMLVELLWFMQGRTDLKWLQERNCKIWNEWSKEDGTIGLGYGHQWRKCSDGSNRKIDQFKELIDGIKNNPESRRLIVNAWNVCQLEKMALPPCHFSFQFTVLEGKLNCVLSQRSGDMFLGVPFNIASYAALTQILSKECGLLPGELIHNIGDAHIYLNHYDQVEKQLTRLPFKAPRLVIDDSIFNSSLIDWVDNVCANLSLDQIKNLFRLEDYNHHQTIKAPVAV